MTNGKKAQAAADAFKSRLEELAQRLADVRRKREKLLPLVEKAEANYRESLLRSETEQEAALKQKNAAVDRLNKCDERILVISQTLTRERTSPEISALADNLFDQSQAHRATLAGLMPEALAALDEARKAYLGTVANVGSLYSKIRRMERIQNRAAAPFATGNRHQAVTPPPDVNLNPAEVEKAFDPGHGERGVNPSALTQEVDAASALAVLTEEN